MLPARNRILLEFIFSSNDHWGWITDTMLKTICRAVGIDKVTTLSFPFRCLWRLTGIDQTLVEEYTLCFEESMNQLVEIQILPFPPCLIFNLKSYLSQILELLILLNSLFLASLLCHMWISGNLLSSQTQRTHQPDKNLKSHPARGGELYIPKYHKHSKYGVK